VQDRLGVDVELHGVASSSRMLLDSSKLSLSSWAAAFESDASAANLSAFSDHFAALESDAIIFDCTAADAPCDYYEKWMAGGVHVITPNKKLHSGPLARYAAVRRLQAEGAAHYFYEVRRPQLGHQ
jgi:homoserine dehydrogenase